MVTSLQDHLSQNLPDCPEMPEESWRKTDPRLFFLPKEDLLTFQGKIFSNGIDQFLPWKIFHRHEDGMSTAFARLNQLSADIREILQEEKHRIVLVDVQIGKVDVYAAKSVKETVEFSSTPFIPLSIHPASEIGLSLARRLQATTPQQIEIKITTAEKTKQKETPLIVIANHVECGPAQSYSAINVVVCEESQAEIVFLDGQHSFAHHRHRIVLEKNAVLHELWTNKTEQGEKGTMLLERQVELKENAKFFDLQVLIPQKGTLRVISNIALHDSRASAISSIAVIASQGRLDLEPIQEHLAGKTESHLNAKMLLFDRGHCNFQGLAIVRKEAQETIATQQNKNLIFGDHTHIDASPRLEILPHNVICKHGSATGELDKPALYYLQTRGFSRKEAVHCLVKSFVEETLSHLQEPDIFTKLAHALWLQPLQFYDDDRTKNDE